MLTGLTDPFSEEAASARYPDQGSGRTLTWTQRFEFSLTTNATGDSVLAFVPKFNFPALGCSVAGGVCTWNATYSGDMSATLLNTQGIRARPTSYGLKVNNVLGATDSGGRIVIAKCGPVIAGSTTTLTPNNFTGWDVHPMLHGGEWHAIGHPLSGSAYDFRANTDTNTAAGDPAWECIVVAILGSKASVAAAYVELTLNYEYAVAEDSTVAQLAVRQPIYSAPMITAINEVQANNPNSHKSGHNAVRSFFKREGKKALLKHVIPFVTKRAVLALA